jgi:hypothetical protein
MCFQLSKAVFTSRASERARASNGQNRKPSPPIFARRCVQMHSRGQSCDTLTDELVTCEQLFYQAISLFLLILPAAVDVRLCTDACDRTRYQLEHAVCLISLRSTDHLSRSGGRYRHGGLIRLLSRRIAAMILLSFRARMRLDKVKRALRQRHLRDHRTRRRTMEMLSTLSWKDTRRSSQTL